MKSQTPKFKLGDEAYGLIGGFTGCERLVHGQISSVTDDMYYTIGPNPEKISKNDLFHHTEKLKALKRQKEDNKWLEAVERW